MVVLATMALLPIVSFALNAGSSGDGDHKDVAGFMADHDITQSPTEPRDIYHLVFDRYGSEPALEVELGIDNSAFVEQLKGLGFQVVDASRANYLKTTMSLAATLGMSTLDGLAEQMGAKSENFGPIVERIESNLAGSVLQRLGYEHIHLGSYYGKTCGSDVTDSVRVPASHKSFADALLARSVLSIDPAGYGDIEAMAADSARFQFAELDSIASEPGPKYVFAHVLLPPTPYVFLEDGTYAPEQANFESQLRYTSQRILEFIEPLLELPESERPIIVLQADEGPFPWRYAVDEDGFDWAGATDDELLMKYGILDATYLPGTEGAAPLPEDLPAINTDPELFGRYLGADVERLPDDSFVSRHGKPYDLTNVTERLDDADHHDGDDR